MTPRLELLDWRRRVAQLYADVRAEPDPARAHAHWVSARTELLLTHPQSPIPQRQRAAAEVRHAPYDPALRFAVDVVDAEPARVEVETGTDGLVVQERMGRLRLDGIGDLDVWWIAGYGGGLFLPMADPGPDSYGGGRYLLDTVKSADLGQDGGRLVVDLNFAYNPSCAYDPAWACPLAPPGNRLDVVVPVGELTPSLPCDA